ncbi:hypothetical protein DFJ58DRAFT_464922 [Suillus subalutaceus]|uniref:uncharacterized protein n=1 Tax=Suillus subalutaceus TaxID=48586 RepID=UPI001B87C332|nr:uncharacterized protein DFJ58DRAFT_464922 [Suillus subalutaceus]KAG1848775.1 hypothetical protein DFJ58DRAFT_464922 [Suillus subalutaceus]
MSTAEAVKGRTPIRARCSKITTQHSRHFVHAQPPSRNMFPKSPYRHIPFFPQTPAGFRMLNPSKKPYFRPSIFSRHPSPRVDSPSNSPARESGAPAFFDCNAPPTQGLPHIFQPASANTARVGRPPAKATVPKVFKKSAPKASPSQIIHPRRKHWHKRFTYHLTVTRPGLRRKGPRFCNPAKLRREKAASALNNLENVALKTMQAGGMTAEDRIFLKQLEDPPPRSATQSHAWRCQRGRRTR